MVIRILAIFDFDGTISNSVSSVLLFRHIGFVNLLKTTAGLFLEKVKGKGDYQKQLIKSLKGMERSKLIEVGKNLPEIEASLELLKKLQEKGHEVLIMSYGLKPVIDSFFEHRNIKVDVIAIDLEFEDGKVKGASKDVMTQLLISDPKYAKHQIVRIKKLQPKFSIGDCKVKDKLSDSYLPVQSFSKPFMRLRQILYSLTA